jgi:hypothetical protein
MAILPSTRKDILFAVKTSLVHVFAPLPRRSDYYLPYLIYISSAPFPAVIRLWRSADAALQDAGDDARSMVERRGEGQDPTWQLIKLRLLPYSLDIYRRFPSGR